MSRFHLPGVFFIFSAFVLLFLTSISLPYLNQFDVARVTFDGNDLAIGNGTASAVTQLRFGLWAYCYYDASGSRTCSPTGYAYSTTVFNSDQTSSITIASSWTRGLAVHPVAAGVSLIALLLCISTHVAFTLMASLTAFLAALLALIAFAIDIALFAFVKHKMGKLSNVSSSTKPAPAFWMTLASLVVLFFAGFTVCLGRRRDRMAGATNFPMDTKKSWRNRFRGA